MNDYEINLRPNEQPPSFDDAFITGNHRVLFAEVSARMTSGYDIASAEQRNKQWFKHNVKAHKRQRQLWIVGAAHLPGLVRRFSKKGWRPHHFCTKLERNDDHPYPRLFASRR